ncbi:P1 family peptidase [Leuconostoc pseudomesenteroides]|uniref:P1 family peptidase n=1 Tax=Leuconostoc pseudomesenteroides TaxID=33968 RepID=UPI00301DA526
MNVKINREEIQFNDIEGIRIGQCQDAEAMTGVSVVIFDVENAGGIDISGGGPASRETHLLSPYTDTKSINALVLSGGSVFGLSASDGVLNYLENKKIGYQLGSQVIPLVVQSSIFDLTIGDSNIRPDAKMGYQACVDAENNAIPKSGSFGAGTGATVGKLLGMNRSQKSGIGYIAFKIGEIKIGAMVVVNAVGDILNYRTGEQVAGLVNNNRTRFMRTDEQFYNELPTGANTTLAAIFTNCKFSEAEMNKIAAMARSGLSRSISPVNTMADGDTIYAFSVGNEKADINVVGSLAANILSEAILKAISTSQCSDEVYLKSIIM